MSRGDLVRDALRRWMAGASLAREEVEEIFGRLMDGELSEIEKTAVLVAMGTKGESPEEIAGAAMAMRQRVVPVEHRLVDVVDTCGTGGDARGTFNISTASALVAAAAGAPVAKHGNRSVSSRSGSADVLEALGVPLDLDMSRLAPCLEEVGIVFLFAPRHHPAMREVMPVRRALGVRTVFNLLGPLTNPAGARRQLLGVFDGSLVEPMARVLLELGTEHALVVHGSDGLDELSTTGSTQVAEVADGRIRTYRLEPEEVGLERVSLEALKGGDPEENARDLKAVLEGEEGPFSQVTALNAGAALFVAGRATDLADGVVKAKEVLAAGRGLEKLEQLRSFR